MGDGTVQLMVIWVCAGQALPPRMITLHPVGSADATAKASNCYYTNVIAAAVC